MEKTGTEFLRENAELRAKLESAEKELRELRKNKGRVQSNGNEVLQAELSKYKRMLGEYEFRYSTLFNQMSEGFALCEVVFDNENEPGDLRILEVNPAVEQLSGLKQNSLVGKTLRQALPKSRLGWIKTCGRVGLDGTPVHFERYSDTLNRHFEISAYSPASGKVACLIRDISHRKRAEAALNEVQERLQLALDTTELGTFDFEPSTGRLVWSKFAWHHFNLPAGAKADKETFLRAVHPEDRPRVERILREALKPGSSGLYSAEYRTIGFIDGKERWISAQGRVFFNSEGNPIRFLGVMLDITRRKGLETERQELLSEFQRQRSLLVSILNQMPIGVTVAESPSGRILLTNDALSEIFGSGMDYEHGLECYQQIQATDNIGQPFPAKNWPLVRAVQAQKSVVDEEIRIFHPDGAARILSASATPVVDQQGKMIAGVSLTTDITERVRMQEALLESRQQLEHKVAERTRELSRVNMTMRMISQCDQAVVQATDETRLIETICNLVYDANLYLAVAVGFAGEGKTKTLRPVAAVGQTTKTLNRVKTIWGNKSSESSAITALRTGKVCIRENCPTVVFSKKRSKKTELGSCIALPLMDGAKVFGVLAICSLSEATFDEEQTNLLKKLADNLAFGIIALRARQDRDQALRHLEQKASQLRALASELARVEEQERRRLAQMLHDELQQLLVGARFQLNRLLRSDFNPSASDIKKVDEVLRGCLEMTRSLTAELSPRVLFEPDFGIALKWLGEHFEEKHGLKVKLTIVNQILIDSEDLRFVLFQAVRELLFNTVKHAGTKTASVHLSQKGNKIQIVVSDRGRGFDPEKTRKNAGKAGGFGLLNLRERISSMGELQVESAPGRGSRFTIVVRQAKDGPGTKSEKI